MKKTVAIVFGGRSPEHEISIMSARNVAAALDKNQFHLTLIGISKQGSWFEFLSEKVFDDLTALEDHELPLNAEPVSLVSFEGRPFLYSLRSHSRKSIDVAFPVLHGTFGEDGCIQGLFKIMNLPFVGCGVFASAAGMDKEVMKRILKDAGLPTARYVVLRPDEPLSYETLTEKLGSPFFIKPASQGSSVGVHKIKSKSDFESGLKDAFLYDSKILAEEFIQGREIECSVLGHNRSPEASVAGEVTPTHEFYSYEAKYLDEKGAVLKIPAEISSDNLRTIQTIAKKTFTAMGCEGLTRVDFFLKPNGDAIVNEINTIPGFTKISMYPKMWEASGVKYSELISKLILLSLENFDREGFYLTHFKRNQA